MTETATRSRLPTWPAMLVAGAAMALASYIARPSWGDALRFVGLAFSVLAVGEVADAGIARLQAWTLARLEARRRTALPERFLLDVREISGGVQRRVLTSLGPEALRARRERRMNTVFLDIWPPCEPGMHVWEGRVDGDAWKGTWRRPTVAELARHAAGEPVWRDG